MNKLNKRINVKFSKIFVKIVCVVGIAFEVLWVLSVFFDNHQVQIPFFYKMHRNFDEVNILMDIIRLAILGAVLVVNDVDNKVHVRTQDTLLVRVIRIIGIQFFMYTMMDKAFSTYDILDNRVMMWQYVYISSYYLLFVIEAYLIVRLIIISKGMTRAIYILTAAAIVERLSFGLLILAFLKYRGVIQYIDTIYFSIVASTYIASYILAIILIRKYKKVENNG